MAGLIPGAFEKAFGFDSAMQEDIESDNEDEHAQDGSVRVCFSREEWIALTWDLIFFF